jgi:NADPH:quinone reductase-like Zn-dependent oxidoreductase
MDFAGHVLAVGDNVVSVRPGQAVVGAVSPRRPEGGAQAELICVPAASVAAVRDDCDLVAAATVPMNALTGLLCLELLDLEPGSTVLITGAAGMLGSLSVELARLERLNVIAMSRDSDRDFLSGLGVSMIAASDAELEEIVRTACTMGVDGVIDGALVGREVSHLVRDGGSIVSPRASYRIEDPRLSVHYVQVTRALEDNDKIMRVGHLLDQSKLTPRVAEGGVFPCSRAADAYRMAQQGGRGRVVITFAG